MTPFLLSSNPKRGSWAILGEEIRIIGYNTQVKLKIYINRFCCLENHLIILGRVLAETAKKNLENRTSPQGAENRGTGRKEGLGGVMGKSEPGRKPGELAPLEEVVSRLEVEGGTGRGDSSRAIQVSQFIFLSHTNGEITVLLSLQ